jgi:type II secretory pathway predicted ATPase ExeA
VAAGVMNPMTRDAGTETALADPHGYLTYYKLSDVPFRMTADPRRLWLGGGLRAVLETLTAAIRQGDGVLLLTGDAGTGKTSAVNWLIETLGGESLLIGTLPPCVFEVSELSQAVADAFGFEGQFPGAAAFATRFREFLADAQSRGTKVLLVIDEAQGLGDDLLRKVFDLSTIGTFEEHPFTILLAGQTELTEALSKDQHAGLHQRITTRCVLEPLTMEEVDEYIRARLRMAGSEEVIFAPDAVRQIASVTCGAPGLINVICGHALLDGYRRQARAIGREIIDAGLGGLGLGDDGRGWAEGRVAPASKRPENPFFPRRRSARLGTTLMIVLLSLVILGAGGYALYVARFARPSGHPAQAPTAAPATERHGQDDAASSPVAVPGDARKASSDKDERAAQAPGDDGPQLPPAGGNRERARSAPREAQAPVPAGRVKRQDTPPRERAGVPAPQRETDANDPGAIIDWLMRKSGPQ